MNPVDVEDNGFVLLDGSHAEGSPSPVPSSSWDPRQLLSTSNIVSLVRKGGSTVINKTFDLTNEIRNIRDVIQNDRQRQEENEKLLMHINQLTQRIKAHENGSFLEKDAHDKELDRLRVQLDDTVAALEASHSQATAEKARVEDLMHRADREVARLEEANGRLGALVEEKERILAELAEESERAMEAARELEATRSEVTKLQEAAREAARLEEELRERRVAEEQRAAEEQRVAEGRLAAEVQREATRAAVLEAVTCQICVEPMARARQLQCGHSFCHKCIVDWAKGDPTLVGGGGF
jgi:chromosome segregation ATPase